MRKIYLVLALLLNSIEANAVQAVFHGAPSEVVTAVISRHEPNLIKIEGRKIKRITGAEGLFAVTPETDTGAAWLKPTSDRRLMSAFITDEEGQHYRLLLKVEDIPAETIIIKGKTNKIASALTKANNRNAPRYEDIINAILALFNGQGNRVNKVIPLWKGTRFELVQELDLRGLRGEAYLLTNTSEKQIVMDEREFYRRGVLSVSIENPILEAGQSTNVYIISEAE